MNWQIKTLLNVSIKIQFSTFTSASTNSGSALLKVWTALDDFSTEFFSSEICSDYNSYSNCSKISVHQPHRRNKVARNRGQLFIKLTKKKSKLFDMKSLQKTDKRKSIWQALLCNTSIKLCLKKKKNSCARKKQTASRRKSRWEKKKMSVDQPCGRAILNVRDF